MALSIGCLAVQSDQNSQSDQMYASCESVCMAKTLEEGVGGGTAAAKVAWQLHILDPASVSADSVRESIRYLLQILQDHAAYMERKLQSKLVQAHTASLRYYSKLEQKSSLLSKAGGGDKQVTPEVIAAHEKELNECLVEVEAAAKKAKEAAAQALETAEKLRQIEEETKQMIAKFTAAANQ